VIESTCTIMGVSQSIAALRAYIPKIAKSSATVLITGETGTGKERVAEAIHALGPRSTGPFVAVNCAALPDSLIESELFGHVRGAFTGAHSAVRGQIAEACGGTLFLDEIGEMPLSAQAKLLRAVEKREVRPVGAARTSAVDVRIVAATNQKLETLVAEQRFRADLFYRLNVVRVDIPPLRERAQDIPVLLHAVIAELNRREGGDVGAPESNVLDCLLAYNWPGNVRELRNLVEALFVDPPKGPIRFQDLPPAFAKVLEPHHRATSPERDRLLQALAATRWNKAEAARSLNWSRMTLYRKLSQYHIRQNH
jgi:DNA-binding NtrC family response regulator